MSEFSEAAQERARQIVAAQSSGIQDTLVELSQMPHEPHADLFLIIQAHLAAGTNMTELVKAARAQRDDEEIGPFLQFLKLLCFSKDFLTKAEILALGSAASNFLKEID